MNIAPGDVLTYHLWSKKEGVKVYTVIAVVSASMDRVGYMNFNIVVLNSAGNVEKCELSEFWHSLTWNRIVP